MTAALILRVATGTWPTFGDTPWPLMAAAIAFSTWVQAGEEVGWRGYALPRLTQHFGLGPASLLLGAIWATWHLPLFFIRGTGSDGQSFPLYLLQVMALSVTMAWLYWKTDGSLLLVMLMHASVNNTTDIVPGGVAGATDVFSLTGSPNSMIAVTLAWVIAIALLGQLRMAWLV